MAMTSIDKRLFPFVSYAFEELIDGRTMHGNRTVQSGLLDRGSLLNVLDDFAFGRLKLLWGNIWLLHRVPSSSCRCSSAFSQSTILSRRCLGASLFLFTLTSCLHTIQVKVTGLVRSSRWYAGTGFFSRANLSP